MYGVVFRRYAGGTENLLKVVVKPGSRGHFSMFCKKERILRRIIGISGKSILRKWLVRAEEGVEAKYVNGS